MNNDKCPRCGANLHYIYGYCYDYDVVVCSAKECHYREELPITTYPKPEQQ